MPKRKDYHIDPAGKMSATFGFLQFKNRERDESLFYEALRENAKFPEMDIVELAFNLKMGGATLGDYHEHAHYEIMLFSSRIAALLQSINIPTVEYLPARIYRHKPKDAFSDDYTILHALKVIDCLDEEKSGMESIILDPKKLENIPLEERLIFRINRRTTVFHKSIAEKINLLDAKGVYFYDLETWNSKTFYLHGFGPKFENP